MTKLSAFQTLPLHIAEKVAFYCMSYGLDSNSTLVSHDKQKRVWSILYNVSCYWRELALKHFFGRARISVSIENQTSQLQYIDLPSNIRVDKDYNNYVKRVSVAFELNPNFQHDHSLRDFSSAWPEDLVFSSAHLLFVDIPGFFDQTSDQNIAFEETKVYWLAQRIPTAMPKLQNVALGVLKPGYPDYNLSFKCTLKAGDFLSVISEKAKSFALAKGEASLPRGNQLMNNTVELTEVQCSFCQDALYVHIIRKSASTLTLLSFTDARLQNIRSLIFNEENKPVVYPRLQNLRFCASRNYSLSEKLIVDKNIALFPALRALWLDSPYIFDDDALFRGSNKTLDYLNIRTNIGIMDILQRCKTFAAGKYSHLSHIIVRDFYANGGAGDGLETFTSFGVNLITPATTTFSLRKEGLHGVESILAETPKLKNIQVLRFSGYKGTLFELITIVKMLPNLTTLECASGKMGLKPNCKRFIKFIDDIHKDSYPISHRFRHWRIVKIDSEDTWPATATALAFTILCTNFTLEYIPPRYRYGFKSNIERLIASGLYDKHIDRIQRLLKIAY